MKTIKILVFLAFVMPMSLLAQEQMNTVADSAAAAYSRGEYEQALQLYDSVYQQGYGSAALYYNLGNSFFKSNEIAAAILFYERAVRLNPGNEDIKNNLMMARQLTMDKIEKVPQLFYIRWWNTIKENKSSDDWAMMMVVAFFSVIVAATVFLVSGRILIRKVAFYAGILLIVFTIFTAVFATQQYHTQTNNKEGIIFNPSVTVKGSPDKQSVDLFVIHEGTKVYIKDKVGEWYEIKIDNGSVGWIPTDVLEII